MEDRSSRHGEWEVDVGLLSEHRTQKAAQLATRKRRALLVWAALGVVLVGLVVLAAWPSPSAEPPASQLVTPPPPCVEDVATLLTRSAAAPVSPATSSPAASRIISSPGQGAGSGPGSTAAAPACVKQRVAQPGQDYRGHPRLVKAPAGAGVVAADQSICSDIGTALLKAGGNAEDAAVATCLVPRGGEPRLPREWGGGFFMTVVYANGTGEFINSRETAPAAAHKDMFKGMDASASLTGGLAIAVPLELKGLELAWQRHGRLPWARLVRPAALLARWGFAAHPYYVDTVTDPSLLTRLQSNPMMAQAFLTPAANGTYLPPAVGQVCCTRPRLADTLDAVAAHGVGWLHTASRAAALAAEIQAAGGIISATDILAAQPEVAPLLKLRVLDWELHLPPPPSSAAILALALQIIAGLPSPATNSSLSWAGNISRPANSVSSSPGTRNTSQTGADSDGNRTQPQLQIPFRLLHTHWTVEALKHAFALRLWLGDPGTPARPHTNVTQVLSSLLDPAFATTLRDTIRDDAVLAPEAYGGTWNPLIHKRRLHLPDDHGTSHLSVLDQDGMAVSLTSTINTGFGSNVISNSTGILFNNEMDDFSRPDANNTYNLPPSEPNFIAPGKRPLSSMSPVVVTQGGSVRAVAGASGGPRIISATLLALVRSLLLKQDALAAVAQPRIHHQFLPNYVRYENYSIGDIPLQVDNQTLDFLRTRGDDSRASGQNGDTQLIWVDPATGERWAASDPRKDGAPASTQ
ncbi:gamma-glutamyltranspeptidase-domain-containing protein [Haematococcus lacustris]